MMWGMLFNWCLLHLLLNAYEAAVLGLAAGRGGRWREKHFEVMRRVYLLTGKKKTLFPPKPTHPLWLEMPFDTMKGHRRRRYNSTDPLHLWKEPIRCLFSDVHRLVIAEEPLPAFFAKFHLFPRNEIVETTPKSTMPEARLMNFHRIVTQSIPIRLANNAPLFLRSSADNWTSKAIDGLRLTFLVDSREYGSKHSIV